MTDSALEAVLRRDHLLVAGALGLIAALAWGYVRWRAVHMDMGGMDMPEFRMIPAGLGLMVPADPPWGLIEFAFVFVMWVVMMIGMMAPSVAPMILMYARVGREGNVKGKPLAATGWFAAGYFLSWVVFSLAATLVAATGWFAAGYFLSWVGFSLAATLVAATGWFAAGYFLSWVGFSLAATLVAATGWFAAGYFLSWVGFSLA